MEQSLRSLPFTFAKQNGILLQDGEVPTILHQGPLTVPLLAELRRFLGGPFALEEVPGEQFQRRLTQAYQRDNNEASQVAEDLSTDVDLTRLADEIPEIGDLMDAEDDAPIIRLINAILSQAVREQASDIHIETFEDRLSVRFRVDGVLSEVLSPKRMLAPLLVSRLKVMAKLDIAEKRVPQDGRISVRLAGHAVDIRMSTIPSAHGERVVLRLLDKQAGQLQLDQLNMNEQVRKAYERGLHSAHGIILVTGPTGSGKTTTLYAGLTHINESTRNILTIEDPIEYMLPGVGQTQVNAKVEMTFARGLRAILRQDPDVVMVGEIRDLETAEIAVQASLTGHLVLSTLHTNTAIGAVTRLQDMGIEPFLLSSSLIGVMAQRLVRLLCKECREEHLVTDAEAEWLGLPADSTQTIYRPKGCDHCNFSGYRGRTGIYELIEIDDAMRTLIHENASEMEMVKLARERAPGILGDGQQRVLSGQTSMEEVMRVTTAG
ncbi:MAG: type II secretion system ATPase GspE [Halieaceae bacterium]|jgi:general secretion pathway protein E|nr:type II secretion system ATPase GspE [Halieaceae bacterium]